MNKRVVFLGAAVVALGVAAWLMPSIDPAAVTPEGQAASAPLQFPTGPTPADQAKIDARKTLPVAPVAPVPANAGAPAPTFPSSAGMATRRDALITALPATATDVVVMEAQTFLNRPIVRGVTGCLEMHGSTLPLDALGLRTEDLDRVALADLDEESSLTVVSGSVGKLDVTRLLKNPTESRHGDHGRIFQSNLPGDDDPANAQAVKKKWVIARWQDAIVLVGRPRAVVEQALDRLEGRASAEPLFAESSMYGDAYGRMSARSVRRLFPEEMATQIEEAGMLAEFHVDAKNELLIVADAQGKSGLTQDVGKAIAAAVAAKRVQAASESDKSMVKLLDLFRVSMTKAGFRLQAGFTEKYLRSQLGACLDAAKSKPATP